MQVRTSGRSRIDAQRTPNVRVLSWAKGWDRNEVKTIAIP